jgi:hypothetical protein
MVGDLGVLAVLLTGPLAWGALVARFLRRADERKRPFPDYSI